MSNGLDISVILCCQLSPKSFSDWGMPNSTPHRHSTLCHNHYHRMWIAEGIGTQQTLKFTFILTTSTLDRFFALNFHQNPSILEVSRITVHTGTPRIFCLTTTTTACVIFDGIHTQKSLKFSSIHTVSTLHTFDDLNSWHSPTRIDIWDRTSTLLVLSVCWDTQIHNALKIKWVEMGSVLASNV
jgi:hypothetical protein